MFICFSLKLGGTNLNCCLCSMKSGVISNRCGLTQIGTMLGWKRHKRVPNEVRIERKIKWSFDRKHCSAFNINGCITDRPSSVGGEWESWRPVLIRSL